MKVISNIIAASLTPCFFSAIQASGMQLALSKTIDSIITNTDVVCYYVEPQVDSSSKTNYCCSGRIALFKSPIPKGTRPNLYDQIRKDGFYDFEELGLRKFDLRELKFTINLIKEFKSSLKTLVFGDDVIQGFPLPPDFKVETQFEWQLGEFFREENGKYVNGLKKLVYNKPISMSYFLDTITDIPTLENSSIYLSNNLKSRLNELILFKSGKSTTYFIIPCRSGLSNMNCYCAEQIDNFGGSMTKVNLINLLDQIKKDKFDDFEDLFLRKFDLNGLEFTINLIKSLKTKPIRTLAFEDNIIPGTFFPLHCKFKAQFEWHLDDLSTENIKTYINGLRKSFCDTPTLRPHFLNTIINIPTLETNSLYLSNNAIKRLNEITLFKDGRSIAYFVIPRLGKYSILNCYCAEQIDNFGGSLTKMNLINLLDQIKKDKFDDFEELALRKFDLDGLRLTINLIKKSKKNLKKLIFGDDIIPGYPLPLDCKVETKFESQLKEFFKEQEGEYVDGLTELVYNKPIFTNSFFNTIISIPSLKRPKLYLADGLGWVLNNLFKGEKVICMEGNPKNTVVFSKSLKECRFERLTIMHRGKLGFTKQHLSHLGYNVDIINIKKCRKQSPHSYSMTQRNAFKDNPNEFRNKQQNENNMHIDSREEEQKGNKPN